MTRFFTPLLPEYTFEVPRDFLSLTGWVMWFGFLVFLTAHNRDKAFRLDRRSLIWMAGLSVSIILLTPFMGFPVGGDSATGQNFHLMVFAALPWMVAGGMLGLIPAILLSGVSGLLLAYLDTHSIFTPLLFMTASLSFSLSVRQRYQGWFFRLLRFPLFSAMVAVIVLVPTTFLALIMNSSGTLLQRAVEGLAGFSSMYQSLAGMVMIGGLVSVLIRLFAGDNWGSQEVIKTAPATRSLRGRFTWMTLSVITIALTLISTILWQSTSVSARRTIVQEMTETSSLVSEGLLEFISAGQDDLQAMAKDGRLKNADPSIIAQALELLALSNPGFDDLAFLNPEGKVVSAFPVESADTFLLLENERPFFQEALYGSSTEPTVLTASRRISFLTGVKAENNEALGVIWGRADLDPQDSLQPYLSILSSLSDEGGSGLIIGNDGLILFHTEPNQILGRYAGSTFLTPTFFEGEDPNFGRVLEYYQPVNVAGLAIVTLVPVAAIQMAAMEIVLPTFLAGLMMTILVLVIGNCILGRFQRDIHEIEDAAEKVTSGELGVSLPRQRYFGELEQLAGAFQKMLGTMRSKMQKQSELLSVSERITGQFKLQDSLQVVLLAALEHGVSSARIVLACDSQKKGLWLPDQQFGLGRHSQAMAGLDADVLMLSQSRGQFVMRDSQIAKHFHLAKGIPYQGVILATPMSWKNTTLGAFWVTFDDRTTLSEDSFAYFTDLAQKAATAVINTKAFDDSLTTQKRFESLLTNLSDPVILADEKGAVIYHNEAAKSLPGVYKQKAIGAPLTSLLLDEDLRTWVYTQGDEAQTKQLSTPDGKTYQASVVPLKVDGHKIGIAALFRDITPFKQQDDLKTELITTASHELRSPLTLVQGYAKILRLTGNLNQQQDAYIGNIIESVEEMKGLVQGLLELGRLDRGDALALEEVSVEEIITRVMASMEPHARQKHIDVRLDLPDESVFIEADSTLLAQAVKNLVDNAIRYTRTGRGVLVSVKKQDNGVVFAVQDEGPGIAPLDQRKIFKPFFQSQSQTESDSPLGSGLGLAIVKSIAERHGGSVWFDSKLGQGSTFYLQIPLVHPR